MTKVYFMRDIRLGITCTSHRLLYKYVIGFRGHQISNLKCVTKIDFVISSERRVNSAV